MKHQDFTERFRLACRLANAPTTMEALGRYLHVSTSMAWNYFNGEKLPSMEKAVEMALKLGVCVEWLLTGRGPMQPLKPAADVLDLSELPEDAKRNLRALVESIRPAATKRQVA
ncbi:MAG: helix-turn-helix transcriptional regulator [Synechococcaceae cyanobacterium SM1_2_3]|nr:helix-turn-helix transcriptional regulator [Synechococcaceae cyanobacterium SM1_2_3]